MACRGVHFALTDAEVAALRACDNDEARLDHLQEEVEERLFSTAPDRVAETDKAWDAMHRLLTDGTLVPSDKHYPLSHLILGGELLYGGRAYIMSLKTPLEVRAVAEAIQTVTKESFRARYDTLDPDDYEGEMGDDDFEYTWEWFASLRDFWAVAAQRSLHVLFTVDQ